MKKIDKAKILTKYFNIYGYGNFDISLEEISKIIEILEQSSVEKIDEQLKEIYERLHQTRMG